MQYVLLQSVLSYLVSVVLDGKAKDTLGFVACDQVHLSIEPGVLRRRNIYTEFNSTFKAIKTSRVGDTF